ncbi:MAG: tetratricopeptide repeat protein [Ginsengibacter sp.]
MKNWLLCLLIFPSYRVDAQPTDSSRYYFNLGLEEKTARRYLVAAKYFDKAIAFNPKNVDAYIENGSVNLEMRKVDPALANFTKANELRPGDNNVTKELTTLYFNNRQFQKAIDLARQCKDCPDAERIIALSNYELEDYVKAIPALQKVLDNNPKDAEATYTLARCYVESEDYKNAVIQFQKAITLNPSHNSWMYELGLVDHNMNDFEGAIKNMNMAAENGYPKTNDFYENLGYAYLYAGDFENALKNLNIVAAKRPNNNEIISEVAFAYFKKQRYDEALNYYSQLLQKNKNDAKSLYMAGMCFQKKGEIKKGQAMCDKAIELDPSLKNFRRKQDSSFGL